MPKLRTRDGAEIYYRVQGTGRPAMIFIHGWCSNLGHWDAQARYFGRSQRVLRIDRRGQGRSTTPGTGHVAAQHAADIAAVARAEGIRSAVVVGHAGGGPSTLELARAYPRLVKALVMVDSNVGPSTKIGDPNSRAGMLLGKMIEELEGPNSAGAFRKIYSGYFGPLADRAKARKAIGEAIRTPIDVAVAEVRSLAIDSASIARELTQPVLWLTAAPANQPAMARLFNNVQFGQVVGSGHFPQLEVPEQFNPMVAAFMAGL